VKYVLIHDAVRPFVTEGIIQRTLAAAKETGAASTAIEVSDTIVLEKNSFIEEVPRRRSLKRIQTPQGFKYETILKAHDWARENRLSNMTDDCGIVREMGLEVKLVEGSGNNIKITRREDLIFAESIVKYEQYLKDKRKN